MAAHPSSKLKSSDQNQLVVHQALHGYSGGHRLLESSCSFTAAAERQIDVLSDLSGSTPPSGFEEYLTIYPVAGMQMMALAKTWLAKEMPRPGCVWTHTFLIDFSAARNLPSLGFFTKYFVRPSKKAGFDAYADALQFPLQQFSGDLETESVAPPSFASPLVQFWYSESEKKPLVIPSESSRTFEQVLFSLWEQQIPALRTTVSISTGSMADRKIGGRSFDIQVAPRQNAREVLRQCRGVNIEDVLRSPSDNLVGWSPTGGETLARDLENPSFELRGFLRTLTNPDVGLTEVPVFAEVFSIWFGPTPLAEKISQLWKVIAAAFPKKEQASNLKGVFFGNSTGILKGEAERLMLRTLLLPEMSVEFLDYAALQVSARCAALGSADASAAVSLLDATSRSHRPSQVLIESFNALIDSVPASVLLQFLEHNRPLLRDILGRRPQLIGETEFWNAVGGDRHEAVAVIAGAQKFSPLLAEALLQIFSRSDGSDLAETFADRASDANLAIFLPAAFKSSEVSCDVFERFLRRRMDTVFAICMSEAQLPATFMVAAARVVMPSWAGNSRFPFAAWAASLHDNLCLQGEEKIRVCAFSVALAFSWKAPESVDFLRFCFSPVYRQAKANRIDYQSWALLEPLVPSLWGRGNWDKCERLRRAILEKVVQGMWPLAILLMVSGDVETLSAFIATASEQGYRSIFPALLQSMDKAAFVLSEQERQTIQRELSV